MSIKTEISCDGGDCEASEEVEYYYNGNLAGGWECDPFDSNVHYCMDCWPSVLKELEEEQKKTTY